MSDDRSWYTGDAYPGDRPETQRGRGQRGREPQSANPYEQAPQYGQDTRGGAPAGDPDARQSGAPSGYGQQRPGRAPQPGRGAPAGYGAEYDGYGQPGAPATPDRGRGGDWNGGQPGGGQQPGGGRRRPDYDYEAPADAYGTSRRGRGGAAEAGAWSPPSSDNDADSDYAGPRRRNSRPSSGADSAWSPGSDGDERDADETRGGRRGRGTSSRRSAGSGAVGLDEPAAVGTINPDLDLDELDPSGKARKAALGKAGPKKKQTRGRRILKWTSISVASVMVIVLGAAAYIYKTTIGDIKHTALLPNGVTQAPLPADPFGNTAMNILLIGSDTRDTASDCSLGGDCSDGPNAAAANVGANADSEMLLHVSADRTNATVMSIPRDTMYNQVPVCSTDSSGNVTVTGYADAQINSALQYGPECQVAAIHMLTNITITGYIMFDFTGVVTMSNALGGVPVCVTTAVDDVGYQTGSGLVLPAGTSNVQGIQALEFLRTRDSFFDGSDIGREEATHYFMSQLILTMRKDVNLGSALTLLKIGQAAAQATTVSNNFSGLSNLEGLAESLSKVPTAAITFVTMPWGEDPNNTSKVVTSAGAEQMFQNIQNDVSYTNNAAASSSSAAPAKTSSAPVTSAPPSVDKAAYTVNVYNADGVTGRAGVIAQALASAGFTSAEAVGDASQQQQQTQIFYPSGDADAAASVATSLGIPSAQVQESSNYSHVTVVIGTDFENGTTYSSSSSGTTAAAAAPTAGAASAPSSSYESNANGSANECIPSGTHGTNPGTLQMASK
jgi:LCP family protein required for cell wall assembly